MLSPYYVYLQCHLGVAKTEAFRSNEDQSVDCLALIFVSKNSPKCKRISSEVFCLRLRVVVNSLSVNVSFHIKYVSCFVWKTSDYDQSTCLLEAMKEKISCRLKIRMTSLICVLSIC